MQRIKNKQHLQLITLSETGDEILAPLTSVRHLPRFPFGALLLRTHPSLCNRTFEVVELTLTGLQLHLIDGTTGLKLRQQFVAELSWRGSSHPLTLEVVWMQGSRLGVEVIQNDLQFAQWEQFLSPQLMAERLRRVHLMPQELGIPLPEGVDYWLSAEGPYEIFIRKQGDAWLMVLFDEFLEYSSDSGLQGGKVSTKRSLKTHLIAEDEMVFQIESSQVPAMALKAKALLSALPKGFLPEQVIAVMQRKLRG